MKRQTTFRAVSAALAWLALPATILAGPNPDSPNGLPCTDGPDYRNRMKGPWDPGRYDGDPIGIRYSPRWDIFYHAQCLDPATPGALKIVLDKVLEDQLITKPGCNGGRAITFDRNGALHLCSDEADSYVRIEGRGADAVWVVGYYEGGAPPPAPAPSPAPRPRPSPAPRPRVAPAVTGTKFVKYAPTNSHDYIVGDDNAANCPLPDPSHPYRELMFGFDLSRLESDVVTPKYAFASLAQDLPPTDACMRVIASALGPSMGCLDRQDNFMLDVTRDGYIGYRTWSPDYAHWSWFAYNSEHPDPGESGPAGKSQNCGKYTGPIVTQD